MRNKIYSILALIFCLPIFLFSACDMPNKHVCKFNLRQAKDEYLRTPATCQSGFTYYYSCECGKAGEEYFTGNVKLAHSYLQENTDPEYLKEEGNCIEGAQYYYSCTTCGKKGTRSFSVESTGQCNYTAEVPEMQYLKEEATLEHAEIYYKSCGGCGKAGETTFEYGKKLEEISEEEKEFYIPTGLSCELDNFQKDVYEFTWKTQAEPLCPILQIQEEGTLSGEYEEYRATVQKESDGSGYTMRVEADLDYSTTYTYKALDRYALTSTETMELQTRDTTSMALFYLMGTASNSQMLGCVVQTKNNTLVIDGGTSGDGLQLVDLLKEKADSKVDAWFFTHPHQDHIGAFYYASQFADIDVRKIYYNFPSVEEVVKNQRSPDEPDMWKNVSPLFEDKYIAQTQVIEKNEIFTFDDVKVKVLRVYNPQLVNNNFLNESSAVYRIYNDTSSFLILGDLGTDGGAEVMKNCALADLQTEYTQMAHHGQNGVTKEFYDYIKPKKCLWPTPNWLWDNNQDGKGYNTGPWNTLLTRAWMNDLGVTEHYVAKDGTQVIEF